MIKTATEGQPKGAVPEIAGSRQVIIGIILKDLSPSYDSSGPDGNHRPNFTWTSIIEFDLT